MPASGAGLRRLSGLNNDFNAGSGEYVEWTFDVDEAGEYDLAIGYAFSSGSAVNRPMRMDVNGELWDRLFDLPTSGGTRPTPQALTRVHLDVGTNTVRLTSNGFSGANIDYLEVRAPDPNVMVIQAEDLVSPMVNDADLSRAVDPALMAARNIAGTNDTFRVGAEGESYLDWGTAGATVDFASTHLPPGPIRSPSPMPMARPPRMPARGRSNWSTSTTMR